MRRQTINYSPWIIGGIALLFVVLLLSGFYLRSVDTQLVLFGTESYTHLQNIDSGVTLSLYEHVLSGVLSLGDFKLVVILFSVLLALASFLLFAAIILRHSKKIS